jgi:glycosyltransferase involved in cell wall biosynthesis
MTELAPWNTQRRWDGVISRKPWEYRITATIPHLETPDTLAVVLDLLRAQTERPYLVVVDTGSTEATVRRLEELRADDCEIHYIRSHAWQHPSEPIAAACDLAMALCQSELLFLTQTDVFLRSQGVIGWIAALCDLDRPVVGYRMSPRHWATSRWEKMVGHTATMLHMPTMRRIGATWSMRRGAENYDLPYGAPAGWPDTETTFNEILREHGIRPHFIGHDENDTNYVDVNLRHCRSYGVTSVYGDPCVQRNWVRNAIAESKLLLESWQRSSGGA